jgi:hypothetical protein
MRNSRFEIAQYQLRVSKLTKPGTIQESDIEKESRISKNDNTIF